MKHTALYLFLSFLILFPANLNAQSYNDTIIYKSDKIRVVEIDDFNQTHIYYHYKGKNGNKLEGTVSMRLVGSFKIYDEADVLAYDSKQAREIKLLFDDRLNRDTLNIPRHILSVNPFVLPFLAVSTRYKWNFGKKLQFAVITRATFVGPILEDTNYPGNVLIGGGIGLTPFNGKRSSFTIDFTPMLNFDYDDPLDINFVFPISAGFDFYMGEKLGLLIDAGFGNQVRNGDTGAAFRGHIGLSFHLGPKKRFSPDYYMK